MCVISPLTAQDIEEAVALWEETGLLRPWNDPRADIAFALGKTNSTVLAGRSNGRLIATAMVGHDGHRGWVYYLAVAKPTQRQGIGAMMMRAAEDWCAKRGAPKMNIMIRSENVAVTDFYASLDYLKNDVTIMAKTLKTSPKI